MARVSVLPQKNRPQPLVDGSQDIRTLEGEEPEVADFVTKEAPFGWRVHDRTHLEFTVDYCSAARTGEQRFEWEAYFYVPESLRVQPSTYDKNDIYEDLQSWVRLAVPNATLEEVRGAPLERVRAALSKRERVVDEAKLFACIVREAAHDAGRKVLDLAKSESPNMPEAATRLVWLAQQITTEFRAAIPTESPPDPETLRWADEEISRVFETVLGSLAIDLRNLGAPDPLLGRVAGGAVREAQYRKAKGYRSVGTGQGGPRDAESLEFRRHVLKRFSSSVLWLDVDTRQVGGMWAHVANGVAAAIAMAFALWATLLNGMAPGTAAWKWGLAAVLAYVAKDRIKAILQQMGTRVVSRYFPDRRWKIRDRSKKHSLGAMFEESGFVSRAEIPRAADAARREGRHPFDEVARPERVLWHRKACTLDMDELAALDPRFSGLSEIFRIDLRRWLANTDDAKRAIVFADPEDGRVYTADAPRVYNIAIVYRFRAANDASVPWHRARVVVTRKGIRRLETVFADTTSE